MSKIKIYVINIFLLVMMTPWFFSVYELESIFGFPKWAFYSLLATIIYAISIFFCLHRYWFTFDSNN